MLTLDMDQHVSSAITIGLRERGMDVVTAFEDGHGAADDELILARATSLGRILFTRDEDFLVIGRRRQQSEDEFTGIVFGHQLEVTIGEAIRDLELIAQVLTAEELRNEILFLPL